MNDLTRLLKSGLRQEATLNSIHKVLNQLLDRIPEQGENNTLAEELLHPNEVLAMLKICERTLFRYRVDKLLKPAGPGGKYYLKSEVMKMCERKKARRRLMIKRMR